MQTNPNNAAPKKPDPCAVVTGECRFSYVHLLEARRQDNDPNSKLKYSVTLLIPKSDAATVQAFSNAINAAIEDGVSKKWKGVKPPIIAHPIHDGDGVKQNGEAFGPECRGHWVMTASTETRPRIVDANLQDIMEASQIYSGMRGRAQIRFYAYDNKGKRGIACGLSNVQKTRDDEPLANRMSAEEAFGGGGYAMPQQPSVHPMQQPMPGYPTQQPSCFPAQQGYPQQPVPGYPGSQPGGFPAQHGYQPPMPSPSYPIGPQPGYQPQQPMTGGFPAQQPTPAAGGYPMQPTAPGGPINPLTGQPMTGGVMGLGQPNNGGMPF